MSITISKNVFAGLSPAIVNSTYAVSEKGWKSFQADYKEGEVEFNGGERIWLQAIADRFKRMSGQTKTVAEMKGILLSKATKFGHYQVSNLENSGFNGTGYEKISLTANSEDDNLEVIIFTDKDGTEYPLIKWTGDKKKPCGNPVRAKKVDKIVPDIKPEVLWTPSGKTRCNNGVSEIEKVSSDGQIVWIPGGNACPPPCSTDFKVVDTKVVTGVSADTTWYKWENACGEVKYTFQPSSKPIPKVDGPTVCNCPKMVDKPKKVYNRYPAFIPQAPYLQQNGMVYVNNQQQRVVYQNIPSPNRGGPVEGNPGAGNPGGGNPVGGNPGQGNPWTGNNPPTGGNPGNNYIYVNGQWIPSGGNPGYYTNPFGNTNGTPANPGYYLNGVWIPSSGNPAGSGNANGGNPVGG